MRKYILRVLLLLLILMPFTVFGADLENTDLILYYEFFSNDNLVTLPSYDNNGKLDGYLFVSGNYNDDVIVKYDLDGNLLYQKELVDDDGSVLISIINSSTDDSVRNYDLFIQPMDSAGNIIFQAQYGGSQRETGYGLYSYNNNGEHDGYLVYGLSYSFDLNIGPGYFLLKYDMNGNLLWEKDVNSFLNGSRGLFYVDGNQKLWDYEYSGSELIKQNPITYEFNSFDTGLNIAGINFSYAKDGNIDGIIVVSYDGVIVKYDLEGNLVFLKANPNYRYLAVRGSKYYDGVYDGYIVSAITSDNKNVFLKYDFNGNLVFSASYDSNDLYYFNYIVDNYSYDGKQNGYIFLALRMENNEVSDAKENTDNFIFQLKYTYVHEIEKVNGEGGVINVSSKAAVGDVVKVIINPKDGFSLKRIVVKDESGKEIEVNSDGTFVMPEGKVIVSAIYDRIVNPDTVSACYVVLGIVLIIAISTVLVNRGKKQESNVLE